MGSSWEREEWRSARDIDEGRYGDDRPDPSEYMDPEEESEETSRSGRVLSQLQFPFARRAPSQIYGDEEPF